MKMWINLVFLPHKKIIFYLQKSIKKLSIEVKISGFPCCYFFLEETQTCQMALNIWHQKRPFWRSQFHSSVNPSPTISQSLSICFTYIIKEWERERERSLKKQEKGKRERQIDGKNEKIKREWNSERKRYWKHRQRQKERQTYREREREKDDKICPKL